MARPVLTSFLPLAAGERHRTRGPGRRVTDPDPPGDGGSPAGAGINLAGTTERGQPDRVAGAAARCCLGAGLAGG
jgi:hypothetical protein